MRRDATSLRIESVVYSLMPHSFFVGRASLRDPRRSGDRLGEGAAHQLFGSEKTTWHWAYSPRRRMPVSTDISAAGEPFYGMPATVSEEQLRKNVFKKLSTPVGSQETLVTERLLSQR